MGSDMFRAVGIGSIVIQIHPVYTRPVRNWNGTVLYGITFKSGPAWYQIADPICAGSTRSRVNTRHILNNSVPVPNGSGQV